MVSYLLQRGCNPNCTNNEGRTPLSFTDNVAVIKALCAYGTDPGSKYTKLLENATTAPHSPPESLVKVFVVGDTGAGKSTLTRSLESTCSTKGVRFLKQLTKVSGVKPKTPGIDPHRIEGKLFGSAMLYDFAGHKEFYASHDSVLSIAVVGASSAIFLIVADLSQTDEQFEGKVQYWLHFLNSKCGKARVKPHVVIIGSHADKVKAGEKARKEEMAKSAATLVQSSLHFAGFVAIDCQYAVSVPMSNLCKILSSSCEALRVKDQIDARSHSLLVYIASTFPEAPAVQLGLVHEAIQNEAKSKEGSALATYLSQGSKTQHFNAVQSLNERGNVLLLTNAGAPEDSWIVVEQSVLLSQVTGTILAPKDFDQHTQLATNIGVVPFSKIAATFPKLDPVMITQFLTQLEFCQEVSDKDILQLLGDSTRPHSQDERFFFFPGLVSIDAPDTIWPQKDGLSYHCGWMLKCTQPKKFPTPKFLQVLLLRIALTHDLTPAREEVDGDHPAIQRKGAIWKNGVYWSNQEGVDAIVEITDSTVALVMRCRTNEEVACVKLRSSIIRMIRKALEEFCDVQTSEHIVPSSEMLQNTPLQVSSTDQHIVPLWEVAQAVSSGKRYVRDSGNRDTDIDTLLYFEPYAHLSPELLAVLLRESHSHQIRQTNRDFFNRLSTSYKQSGDQTGRKLVRALILAITKLRERVCPTDNPVQALVHWKDATDGTYHCFRSTLDEFSIFAGKNPLEIAGVKLPTTAEAFPPVTEEDTHAGGEVLTLGDFREVRGALHTARLQWHKLGIELGMSVDDLENIKDEGNDNEQRLEKMVKTWLSTESLRPSWEKLIAALQTHVVGREDVAQDIMDRYLH